MKGFLAGVKIYSCLLKKYTNYNSDKSLWFQESRFWSGNAGKHLFKASKQQSLMLFTRCNIFRFYVITRLYLSAFL